MREFEKLKSELEEVRVRPVLLGACKMCPTLKEELEQARADFEKWSAPSTVCEASLSLRLELADRRRRSAS